MPANINQSLEAHARCLAWTDELRTMMPAGLIRRDRAPVHPPGVVEM